MFEKQTYQTFIPFQTRVPEQVLTTKQRPYTHHPGRPCHQVASDSFLLRDYNPNRYGKLDRSEKTQSNFSKCRHWNGQTRHIPLAIACFSGQKRHTTTDQKRHSRLSKNIPSQCCVTRKFQSLLQDLHFTIQRFLCKSLQRWSLPARCLFHVSSLLLKPFKPSGGIHR
jgi:hypothetical protein